MVLRKRASAIKVMVMDLHVALERQREQSANGRAASHSQPCSLEQTALQMQAARSRDGTGNRRNVLKEQEQAGVAGRTRAPKS